MFTVHMKKPADRCCIGGNRLVKACCRPQVGNVDSYHSDSTSDKYKSRRVWGLFESMVLLNIRLYGRTIWNCVEAIVRILYGY